MPRGKKEHDWPIPQQEISIAEARIAIELQTALAEIYTQWYKKTPVSMSLESYVAITGGWFFPWPTLLIC